MANVLDLRRRIRSVKSTRQITKAMKMIAAAKLRRAQERAVSARPYANMLASVIGSLMRHIDLYDPATGEVRHPLLLEREEKRVLLIVVSGDKGFAGAFNGNIAKAAFRFIANTADGEIDIAAIGRKGRDLFRRRYSAATFVDEAPEPNDADRQKRMPGATIQPPDIKRRGERKDRIEVAGDYPGMLDKPSFDRVAELGREIVHRYVEEEIDAAYVVYNEFKSVIAQRVVVERILPIMKVGERSIEQAEEMTQEEREQAAIAELLDGLLRQYVTTQIYHAVIESTAAEQAARMTAMDAATNNASEMIDSLTLTMNRVRQAAITKEIIEIVSGAAAL
jgi:F-type H+-transporting ATPase subunit gamma